MSLQVSVIQSLTFLLIAGIVYLLTRALNLHPKAHSFENPERAGLSALLAIWIGWLLTAALFIFLRWGGSSQHAPLDEPTYGPDDVLNQILIAVLAFSPALVAMRLRREPLESAGIGSTNLLKALLVGLVLALLTLASLFFSGIDVQAAWDGLSTSHFWALIVYLVVGFSEEFAFRGYLQTRLVTWLGTLSGWVIASLVMAFAHVIQRMTMMGLSLTQALLSSAFLIPISLLMGYIMLRTGNIVTPGIFHTMVDWVNTLG